MAHIKWTNEMRKLAFTVIRNKYGACTKDNYKDYSKKLYQDEVLLNKLTSALNTLFEVNISEKGLQMQLKWAFTIQNHVKEEYVRSFFLNKAVALEVGIIDNSLLPKELLFDYNK
jgi:hypothetical protein